MEAAAADGPVEDLMNLSRFVSVLAFFKSSTGPLKSLRDSNEPLGKPFGFPTAPTGPSSWVYRLPRTRGIITSRVVFRHATTTLTQGATVPDSPYLGYGKLFPGQVTPVGYQFQWWSLPDEDSSFLASGIHGQFIFVNPVLDLVVVVLSNWPMGFDADKWLETHALFLAVESHVRGVV